MGPNYCPEAAPAIIWSRTGLSIVPVVPCPRRQPPSTINCQIVYHAVLTFERAVYAGLNVTLTTLSPVGTSVGTFVPRLAVEFTATGRTDS